MVKKIYNDMLTDLGLEAANVPLFVGETLREDQGGACYYHNTVVAKMPRTVPTSHIVSSEGCPGNGTDPWHFSALGYRMMGYRYAFEALKLMNQPLMKDEEYTMPNNLKQLFTVKELSIDVDSPLTLKKGRTRRINVTATFLDGHSENVTDSVRFTVPEFVTVNGNQLKSIDNGSGEVTVSYTDFARTTSSLTFSITTGTGTGVETPSAISPEHSTPVIFNAAGQRVGRMGRGLNIINGKKVMVK